MTKAGKDKVSHNAWKGGNRPMLRHLSKMFNAEMRAARDRAVRFI